MKAERKAPTPRSDIPPGAWVGSIRVRFAHCDPAGIVYFPRFFELCHALVEDWMAERIDLSHAKMTGAERIGLGYAHAEADFFTPARDGDRLQGALLVTRVGTRSLSLSIPLYRDDVAILSMHLVMVTTSLATHEAIVLPSMLKERVVRYADASRRAS